MLTETIKFKIFYFVRYFGDAFFYPFMSIYFISKGMSEHNLGFILAITPITTILVNPLWNFIVKDMKISRFILKIMTLIEGALIILLTQISGFELYALVICLIAFFCSPFISIQDGYTATFTDKMKIEYSSIRIHASIAYVIASAIAGYVILYLGFDVLFITSGIFFGLTALIAIWIKPIEKAIPRGEKPKRDFKTLLKNKDFFKYLVFYTLVIGSVRIGDSFFGVYLIQERALSTTAYGLLYSAFVFVEVLTLRFLMTKGNFTSEKTLFLLASSMFALRFLVYGFNLPLEIVIIVTMLRGISGGIFIFANIKYIIKIVRVENITTAILMVMLAFSIYTALGNMLAGRFIETSGYNWLYLINLILIVFGIIFFLLFTPKVLQMDNQEDNLSTLE
ncbi:MAG: MFS transporter [Firmicutes bacterium]|nr:MFS transporter [Bacillota bacterium]